MFFSTRLIDAAEEGRLDLVKQEIESGADVNERGMLKMTALMGAAAHGREDVVKYLLEQPGIDVDTLNAGGTTALMAAARKGYLGVVKVLLADPRCNVNTLGKYGGTALMNAAGFNHIEVVRELLKHDEISLAATYSDKKYSPITIAKRNGFDDIVNLLEAFEARRNAVPVKKYHKGPRF